MRRLAGIVAALGVSAWCHVAAAGARSGAGFHAATLTRDHAVTSGRAGRLVRQMAPPFVEAIRLGFVIALPCDVAVARGRFSWAWEIPPLATAEHPRAPLAFHAPAQLEGAPFATPGRSAIKFNSFWTIELQPGWSLFVTHPINRCELPFRTLTGNIKITASEHARRVRPYRRNAVYGHDRPDGRRLQAVD